MFKRIVAIGVLSAFFCIPALAQTNNPDLRQFSAKVVDQSVFLTWRTSAGFSCQDVIIQVSDRTFQFEQAGVYLGICGDTAEKSYSFLLKNQPTNKNLFVRLDLGNTGVSDTLPFRIQSLNQPLWVYPNPVQGSFIHISSSLEVDEIFLYNIYGQEVTQQVIRQGEELIWDVKHLQSGTYVLWVETKHNGIRTSRVQIQ